jgi:hypothetical protein
MSVPFTEIETDSIDASVLISMSENEAIQYINQNKIHWSLSSKTL